MPAPGALGSSGALGALRRFAAAASVPVCGLCAGPLADDHRHAVLVDDQTVVCACRPCHLVLAPGGRHVPVGDRVARLPVPADVLARGEVPVGLAYAVRSSSGVIRTLLPGPAGATELEADLLAAVETVPEPDVEALLVDARSRRTPRAWIVPVDVAHALAGEVRRAWTGFSGGDRVPAVIDETLGRIDRWADAGRR